MIGLLILINKKGNSYNLISIIFDELQKIVYYELIKVIINIPSLAKVIIDVIMLYHRVLKSIIIN